MPTDAIVSVHPTLLYGRFKAWLQVIGCFLLFMNSWGIVNSYGVFQAHYVSNILKNKSEGEIAWIGSIQAFLLLACSLITGPIFDRGYGVALILAGGVGTSFGLSIASIATQYYQFILAQGICTGVFMSCLFIPSVSIIPLYFTTNRSIALGIATAGSSVGGIIYPIVFQHLLKIVGFAWTVRVIGLLIFASTIAALSIIRLPSTPKCPRKLLDLAAFRQTSFTLYTIACVFAFMTIYTPIFFSTTYAQRKIGMSDTLAFYTVSIVNAGSISGRLIPGLLADRFGVFKTLIVCTIICAGLGFSWIAMTSTTSFIVFSAFYGAFSGSYVSLQASTVPALTPDLGLLGTRMGMNSFIGGLGLLIGQPVAGMLLERWDWLGVQLFCGSGVLLAAVSVCYSWMFKYHNGQATFE